MRKNRTFARAYIAIFYITSFNGRFAPKFQRKPAAASSIVEASGNSSSVDIVQPVISISIGVFPILYFYITSFNGRFAP